MPPEVSALIDAIDAAESEKQRLLLVRVSRPWTDDEHAAYAEACLRAADTWQRYQQVTAQVA